jgi:outer membrane lipoprotein-sorting protein
MRNNGKHKRARAARLVSAAAALALAASCSGRAAPEDLEADIKDSFRGAGGIEATANITADYGDDVFDFTVKYVGTADMGTVEILKPDAVAGVVAKVAFPECYLEYDGASVESGPLTGDGLSPVQALPVLLGQWTDGYAEITSSERIGDIDALAIETRITDTASQKTWFDFETLLPVRSEIYDMGKMVVACDMESILIR